MGGPQWPTLPFNVSDDHVLSTVGGLPHVNMGTECLDAIPYGHLPVSG